MNYKKVGVITLAITLMAIGGLFLVNNFVDLQLSRLFSILWPSIIVLLGLEIIISKLISDKREEDHKISVSGGSIFLLTIFMIGLILFSNINFFNGVNGFNFISFDFNRGVSFFPINSKYDSKFTRDLTIETEDKEEFFIENSFGDITVDKGQGKNIEVEAKINIKNNDEEYADEVSREILEVIKNKPNVVSLRSKVDNYLKDKDKIQSISIDLLIKMPEDMKLDIDSRFGDVFVSNISNKVIVKNQHGDINLDVINGDIEVLNEFGEVETTDIQGNAIISNKHGEIFTKEIDGDLEAKNAFGDMDIDSVNGRVKLVNQNSEIKVYNVENNLYVENKFGDVVVKEVKGDLEIIDQNAKIDIEGIAGEVRVENRFGDIEVREAYKSIDIINKNGNVDFISSKEIEKYLKIDNEFGDITVTLPKNQSGYFDLYTKYGDIKSQFEDLVIKSELNEETTTKSIGDEDVIINLRGKNGDIDLKAR